MKMFSAFQVTESLGFCSSEVLLQNMPPGATQIFQEEIIFIGCVRNSWKMYCIFSIFCIAYWMQAQTLSNG